MRMSVNRFQGTYQMPGIYQSVPECIAYAKKLGLPEEERAAACREASYVVPLENQYLYNKNYVERSLDYPDRGGRYPARAEEPETKSWGEPNAETSEPAAVDARRGAYRQSLKDLYWKQPQETDTTVDSDTTVANSASGPDSYGSWPRAERPWNTSRGTDRYSAASEPALDQANDSFSSSLASTEPQATEG